MSLIGDGNGEQSAHNKGSVPLLSVTTARHDDVVVVSVTGSLDALTAPHLDAAVHNAVATRPGGLIVDLTDTDFLASAGMSALINAQHATEENGSFAVVADGPATSRPLTLVGLDRVFPIYPTLAGGLSALT